MNSATLITATDQLIEATFTLDKSVNFQNTLPTADDVKIESVEIEGVKCTIEQAEAALGIDCLATAILEAGF